MKVFACSGMYNNRLVPRERNSVSAAFAADERELAEAMDRICEQISRTLFIQDVRMSFFISTDFAGKFRSAGV
ncbi:hypothetical protein ACVIGB_008604 [Bradyrhizobium sp. USDA 4341]